MQEKSYDWKRLVIWNMHKKGPLNKHESTPLLQIKKLIYSVPWPFLFNDGSQGKKLNVAVSPLFMTRTAFSGKVNAGPERQRPFLFLSSVCLLLPFRLAPPRLRPKTVSPGTRTKPCMWAGPLNDLHGWSHWWETESSSSVYFKPLFPFVFTLRQILENKPKG